MLIKTDTVPKKGIILTIISVRKPDRLIKDVFFLIRDTAGKKKFESQSQLFLKGVHGVIYCFDLTNAESLRNVQNWVQKLNIIQEGLESQ
jgi:GTPase SAR1 family protein